MDWQPSNYPLLQGISSLHLIGGHGEVFPSMEVVLFFKRWLHSSVIVKGDFLATGIVPGRLPAEPPRSGFLRGIGVGLCLPPGEGPGDRKNGFYVSVREIH